MKRLIDIEMSQYLGRHSLTYHVHGSLNRTLFNLMDDVFCILISSKCWQNMLSYLSYSNIQIGQQLIGGLRSK